MMNEVDTLFVCCTNSDTNEKRYGKFIQTQIFEKKGTVLTLYLQADEEIINIDFKNEKNLKRMAIYQSVSECPAQRDLKCLNVDDVVDVNPSLRNRLRVNNTNSKKDKDVEKKKEIETIWYPGRIRKMDKHSGQVQSPNYI